MQALLCVVALLLIGSPARASVAGPLVITTPNDHSTITAATIRVEGTAVSADPNFAVIVNGMPALIDLERAGTRDEPFRWFAEMMPPAGRTKITAVLVEATGKGGPTAVRHVDFAPDPHSVAASAHPASGVTPLDVIFYVHPHIDDEIARAEIDYEGDGDYDESATGHVDRFTHRYTTPGSRLVSIRLTLTDGTIVTSSTAVATTSFRRIDSLLQSVWRSFVDALGREDVTEGLTYVAESKREKYRSALLLMSPTLPEYAQGIRTIVPLSIGQNTAQYLMRRNESGTNAGYYVSFGRGRDGIWKIVQF